MLHSLCLSWTYYILVWLQCAYFFCVRMQMVQTFSRCVLSCEEEVDLDELLATRLLSFLIDHHQEVLQVPMYLRNAVEQHIAYFTSQVTNLIFFFNRFRNMFRLN